MKKKRGESDRREHVDEVVLSAAEVFLLPEQHFLARLDRRRGPRRGVDARRRLTDQWRQMVALSRADTRRLVEAPPAVDPADAPSAEPAPVELLEPPPAPALQDLFESDPPPMPDHAPLETRQRTEEPPTPPRPGRRQGRTTVRRIRTPSETGDEDYNPVPRIPARRPLPDRVLTTAAQCAGALLMSLAFGCSVLLARWRG